MYPTSTGLQEHEIASTLKVLRGSSASDGVYYYGQSGHSRNHNQQWGYEEEYQTRCTTIDPNLGESQVPHTTGGSHQGRQQLDYKNSGESRLSQHAMQKWDSVRLSEQKREREREPSTSQGVSSLAFLYGIPSSQVHSTLVTSSSAISTIGSSSDGNRSPDSDDPSEGATDNSQSSRSLCGGNKTGDRERGSISSASISSGESSHKRNCHSHHNYHNVNSAQWQSGYEPPETRLGSKVPGYQHYDQDGYSNSSIYPTYLPQPRSHISSQHHPAFRPGSQQQQQLSSVHIQGHMQTQAQTQAQMMHARYLNYQQNVRQVQVREQGVPKVAPIVIPTSEYLSKTHIPSQIPTGGTMTMVDDHEQCNSKSLSLIGKNHSMSSSSVDRDPYLADAYGNSVLLECDSQVSKGRVESHGASKIEREDRYVVLIPSKERSSLTIRQDEEARNLSGSSKGSPGRGGSTSIQENNNGCERMCSSQSGSSCGEDGRRRMDSLDRINQEEEDNTIGGDLILDEPLGDATHALLSFCMQRNPWMYSQSAVPDEVGMGLGSILGGEGLLSTGPNTLYKDILSCLVDTPLLRAELECYSEALNPSLFPLGTRRRVTVACHTSSASRRRKGSNSERSGVTVSSEGYSSSDESTAGDITDGSQDSGEQASHRDRPLSYFNNKMRKRDAVEDMRSFTTFASLRMQEVSDLVCEQEVRRASRRELDKHNGQNNWSRGDGFGRDAADSAAAAAFMKALETCTQTWWAYSNLYK